ncbi:serine hydrolase domain-containing protein [Stenotrophomonas sp.]|uniref:serine hydrolase domain-containing protein n=1 Tax=Stenotrophomonas sp. TaxID=69392 RepID=UPI002FC58A51
MRLAARVCGIAMLLCSFLAAASAPATPEQLRALVDSYASHRGFNGTVLVAREGKVLLLAAHGKANAEWSVPNRTDGRFRIGSLTKPLVATLTMQLVEQGTLALDGTLGGYLPELYGNTPAASVTVAQLLSHTSGLADVPARYTDPWWQTAARRAYTPMDFAREWIPPTLREAPGQQWRYNNNGFFLLGVVIERVTGASLADNLQARIFAPAGMTASGLYGDGTVLERLAQGYARTPQGQWTAPQWIDPSVSYAAAGIYTTAEDLYRFDQALYGTSLLQADTRATMLQARAAGYGFGWNVETWTLADGRTLPVVSHTGSVPGYQSYYLRAEPHRDAVIILDNLWQGALVAAMGRDLLEVLNGKPMQPAKRSLDDLLTPIAYQQGVDAMARAYTGLGARGRDYDQSEAAFNSLGYKFLRADRKEAAVRVLEWGAAAYPASANAHDSLGEAYRAAGRRDPARRSYQTALTLDPASKSARAALAELEGEHPPR